MTTTENSRAEALTDRLIEFDVLLDGYQEALQGGAYKERVDARSELRLAYRNALLAASHASQLAAAPADEWASNAGTLTAILKEYREGKRGLPTYAELAEIASRTDTCE